MTHPDDIERQRRKGRLTKSVQRGDNARMLLQHLEPVFEARRQQYYMELVSKSRSDGTVCESAVWKMVALDDLVRELDNDVGGGKLAEKRLEEMNRDE